MWAVGQFHVFYICYLFYLLYLLYLLYLFYSGTACPCCKAGTDCVDGLARYPDRRRTVECDARR